MFLFELRFLFGNLEKGRKKEKQPLFNEDLESRAYKRWSTAELETKRGLGVGVGEKERERRRRRNK